MKKPLTIKLAMTLYALVVVYFSFFIGAINYAGWNAYHNQASEWQSRYISGLGYTTSTFTPEVAADLTLPMLLTLIPLVLALISLLISQFNFFFIIWLIDMIFLTRGGIWYLLKTIPLALLFTKSSLAYIKLIKHNKALKAQPSAAGDAASGAP